jgi:hypothetical protein
MPVPRREDLCRKYYYAVSSKTEEVQRFIAAPMCCKSWDCPACRKIKAKEYNHRLRKMWDFPKLYFLTLTYFHSMSPDEAWSTYNAAWNRLRTNLSKQFGEFEYVRVLESHNNSPYPHLHLITNRRFPESKLGPAAIAAGFGYQISQKTITNAGAAYYIAKYLTKEWKNEEGWRLRKKNRCRIISFSRGVMSPKTGGGNWNSLLVGSALAVCIERISTEISWNAEHYFAIKNEKLLDDYYELTVEWRDDLKRSIQASMDDWSPDDWIPK